MTREGPGEILKLTDDLNKISSALIKRTGTKNHANHMYHWLSVTVCLGGIFGAVRSKGGVTRLIELNCEGKKKYRFL